MAKTGTASLTIAELREFAGFAPAEQRYIKRSLDIGLSRQDAFRRWARGPAETASIRGQYLIYQELRSLRGRVPAEDDLAALEPFMGKLLRVTAYDIAQDRLTSFAAYRFLYERLLGAEVRPFLPSAFCAAAALPQIRPARRKQLLQSISEAAATAPAWSSCEPSFYPEWVEQEAA
jgi:hypothetical protein